MSYGNYGNHGGYGSGDYQNTAGDGAGGFVNTTFGGTQGGSQTAAGGGFRDKKNTIRPVTIKQILEASSSPELQSDNTFKIDDNEVNQITLVARVSNVTEQPTNINFVINDGTGQMDAKKWVDSDNPPDGSSNKMNGQYIRCIGQIKIFGPNNKRHVAAHAIRLVTDYNEVQYHLLETTAIHLHFTRGPASQFVTSGDGSVVTWRTDGESKTDTPMGGMGAMGSRATGSLPPGASRNARIVLETIKSSTSHNNDGMHVRVICEKSGLQMSEVSKAVEELQTLHIAYEGLNTSHVAVIDL